MSLYEIKQAGVPNVSFVLHEETSRYSRDVAVVPANTPALAADVCVGGDFSDAVRVRAVAGAGTSAGASQTVRFFATQPT